MNGAKMQDLRQSEARFRAFVMASSDVVYRMSPDWKEMLYLKGQDFLADTEDVNALWIEKYIPVEDRPTVLAAIAKAIRTRSVFALEHRVIGVDGTIGWTQSHAVPLLDENGDILEWFGTAKDVTDRRRTEEALREMNERLEEQVRARTEQVRALVTQLTFSEQEERRRISAILHDDLQQRLFSVNFQLEMLRQMLDGQASDAARQMLTETGAAVRESVQMLRDLSVSLSPPVLPGEGLYEAVRWLASLMAQQHGLAVDVRAEQALPQLDEDLRVLLFQIVRELLFNVVKHAGVAEAAVALASDDGQLRIEVRDAGRGFDPSAASAQVSSQGLLRAAQKLQLLGGRIQIQAHPGQGTRVTIHLPLPNRTLPAEPGA